MVIRHRRRFGQWELIAYLALGVYALLALGAAVLGWI